MKIKVGLSNHHVHLTKSAFEMLYGEGMEMHVKRNLNQSGEYACEEVLNIECNGKLIENVRLIGPFREYIQVELLSRDASYFGINPPLRNSGDLENSESVTLIGPKGKLEANSSVIIANRHLHLNNEELKEYGLNNGQIVSVKLDNGTIIDDIHVKAKESFVRELHLNKDEGESLELENGSEVTLC